MYKPASEKQIDFIKNLLDEKEHALDEIDFNNLSMQRASSIINTLLHAPRKESARPAPEGVTAGRYAVEEDGTLHFFVVDVPTEGKWSGYTFLKIQASNETYPIKNKERRKKVFSLIKADPITAMERYGQELGICGRCGRTLTNEESRARGIGPICAGLL